MNEVKARVIRSCMIAPDENGSISTRPPCFVSHLTKKDYQRCMILCVQSMADAQHEKEQEEPHSECP